MNLRPDLEHILIRLPADYFSGLKYVFTLLSVKECPDKIAALSAVLVGSKKRGNFRSVFT